MNRIKIIAGAILLASSFQAAAEIKALNSIAAEVNASIITYGDVERAVRVFRLNPASQNISNEQLAQTAKQQLIQRALMVEAAKSRDLKVSNSEIDAEIQRRATIVQKTVADMYAQAQRLGWGRDNYRIEVAKDLLAERAMELLLEEVQVSDGQVQNYILQAQKEGKTLPESRPYTVYQVQRILLNINENNKSSAVGERVKLLAQALQQGSAFDTLAKRYSQEASAAQGGLREIKEGEESEKVQAMLNILPTGQISAPIQTAKNWQILKMVSKRTETNPAKMQEYAVRQWLLKQEQDKVQGQFIGSLMRDAVVREF